MDAFGITLNDLMLRAAVARRRPLAFAMTARAQVRHFGGEGGRGRIGLPAHGMRAMAFDAGRRINVLRGRPHAVEATLELIGHGGMAGGAIHTFHGRGARPVSYTHLTLPTNR